MAKQSASYPEGGDGATFCVRGHALWIFLAFAAIALAIDWPALDGPFIGDDGTYVVDNPFIESLDVESVGELFVPGGSASLYVVNYAPLHLLTHGVQRFLFGPWSTPYHLTNVLVHALAGLLLVALLVRSRIGAAAALLGGLFFVVHPANVEAVAQISQLKTTLSLVFALGALLWLRERPVAAALLFAAALLTKASALFALPMAAALLWSGRASSRAVWGFAAWVAIFGLYAIPQFQAFDYGGQHVEPAFEEAWVQLRTVAAIGLRYLVMAATSYGVAPLQEPPPVTDAFDPWWLLAIPVGLALAWRIVVSLRARSDEAAWWLGAAAAFAPISQIFPFIHPVADRYLYPILPGLIGGVLLAGRDAVGSSRLAPSYRRVLAGTCIGLGLALCGVFAVRGFERAALWAEPLAALVEASRLYPDGSIAWYMRGREAAQAGDAETAVYALRQSHRRAQAAQRNYFADSAMAPVIADPVFLAFARERAAERLEFATRRGLATQHWLRVRAHDHLIRDEIDEALAFFEEAQRVGGPRDDVVQRELEATREMVLDRQRGEPVRPRFRPLVPAVRP